MKLWIVTFFLLFATVELFEWAKQFALPLPIYVLGGAILAIASNYEKGITIIPPLREKITTTATIEPSVKELPSVSEAETKN